MKKLSYKEWVYSFVKNLETHLNLSGWTIRLVFVNKEKGDTVAEMDVNHVYLHAVMRVYPQAHRYFKNNEMDMLVQTIVHEMVHVFIDPFHEFTQTYLSPSTTPLFMNIVEQQTQKLTMVLLKTLPESLIPPR